MTDNYKHTELTDKIIKVFFEVYNRLGYGFLEKVYENALSIALIKAGFNVKKQEPIKVFYDGIEIGNYYADLIINDLVIIEIKACDGFIDEHAAQLTNYLKATKIEVGLLLNFGPKAQVKRRAYNNENKILK